MYFINPSQIMWMSQQKYRTLIINIIIVSEFCKQIYTKQQQSRGRVSNVDGEVPRCAAQGPAWGQGFGDVLQGEGRGLDLHGQTDHQVARGAPERPAVPRLDVWLDTQGDKAVNHVSADY